jgi:molybdenum cofactor cytidylyltransferase
VSYLSERTKRVAAVVLAAGQSTRMGAENKLIAEIGGAPLVRRTVDAVCDSSASPILVVVGYMRREVCAALEGAPVTFVANPDFAKGLASSLKAGVRALPSDSDGVIVLLGDMPRIAASHIDRLVTAFRDEEGSSIMVPTLQGRRGNPVLWPAAYFRELLDLDGDTGAKALLARHREQVKEVDLGTDAIFLDVDTPQALQALRDVS